jgi:TIR domain
MQRRVTELEAQIAEQLETNANVSAAFRPTAPEGQTEAYDVFISHASEDKPTFVDDLAARAKEAGLRIWYDTAVIEWGDSLRQKIDAGLAGSYFGIAVLSPAFFEKPWPNYELDGLLERVWFKLNQVARLDL